MLDVDGRQPKSVSHAIRILGSYQAGEKLKLGIMRDKKRVTIDVEIPADYHGRVAPASDFAAPTVPVSSPFPESPRPVVVEVDTS